MIDIPQSPGASPPAWSAWSSYCSPAHRTSPLPARPRRPPATAHRLRRPVRLEFAILSLKPGVPSFMETAGNAFARHLGALAGPHLRSTRTYFDAEDHGSVPLISLYHGLTFLFEGYKPSFFDVRERPSGLVTHFERVSSRLGVELTPPEQYVNGMASAMLSNDEVDKALELLQLNVSLYPTSYNVYDRLATGGRRGRGRDRHPGATPTESTRRHPILSQVVENPGRHASATDHRQAADLWCRVPHRDALGRASYRSVRQQPSRGLT